MKLAEEKSVYHIAEDFFSKLNRLEPGDYYPKHYHDHYEMMLVVEGKGNQDFDGKEFTLRPRDIFLLRPEDYHDTQADPKEGLVLRKFEIKKEALPRWAAQKAAGLKNPIVYHASEKDFNAINGLLELLEEEVYDKKDGFLEITTMLDELIFTYFFRLDEASNGKTGKSFIERVTYFLEHDRRFTKKTSLDEIAAYTGYSKFYTSSMFRRLYGTTLQEYIMSLRIDYAKKLLEGTDYTIAQVIQECGFSSASNFYAHFQKEVGASPIAYRKKIADEKAHEAPRGVDKEYIVVEMEQEAPGQKGGGR